MAQENPYSPPQADLLSAAGVVAPGTLTSTMRQHLGATRPWVRFLAVLGYVSVGLFVLSLAITAIAARYGGKSFWPALSQLFFGFLYFIYTVLLHRYGKALFAAATEGTTERLAQALTAHRRLWRAVVLPAVVLVPLGLVVVASMAIATSK